MASPRIRTQGQERFITGGETLLMGGDENDILFAGAGGNTLVGNGGADEFWLATGAVPQVSHLVTDFTPGVDRIGISGVEGVNRFQDLSLTSVGEGTMVTAQDRSIALLAGVPTTTLGESDFVIRSTV